MLHLHVMTPYRLISYADVLIRGKSKSLRTKLSGLDNSLFTAPLSNSRHIIEQLADKWFVRTMLNGNSGTEPPLGWRCVCGGGGDVPKLVSLRLVMRCEAALTRIGRRVRKSAGSPLFVRLSSYLLPSASSSTVAIAASAAAAAIDPEPDNNIQICTNIGYSNYNTVRCVVYLWY